MFVIIFHVYTFVNENKWTMGYPKFLKKTKENSFISEVLAWSENINDNSSKRVICEKYLEKDG